MNKLTYIILLSTLSNISSSGLINLSSNDISSSIHINDCISICIEDESLKPTSCDKDEINVVLGCLSQCM